MTKRTVGLATIISLVLGLSAHLAFAHTHVRETSPPAGESLEAAPTEVWIQFGEAGIPPQPGQITGGTLQVLDPCGRTVSAEETTFDATTSTLTVASEGAPSGRYEVQWTVTAADGAVQSGFHDFFVTTGPKCTQVVRDDAAEDVTLGVDPVRVTSKRTSKGALVTVATASALKCSTLKNEDQTLELVMDTSHDGAGDVTGRFGCAAGKYRFTVSSDDETIASLAATKPSGSSIAVNIPRGVLTPHLDLYVSSSLDSPDCDAEGAVCADRAPDLGLLRTF